VIRHERLRVVIEHRTGNINSIDRIGPVEDDKPFLVLGCCFERFPHGRDIGIEPRPDILNIEYHGIDFGKHCGGRFTCFPIQAVDLKSSFRIPAIVHLRDVELSLEAMLWTKQSFEF